GPALRGKQPAISDPGQKEKGSATLSALWVLHRNLPDIGLARRRTRYPARTNLPDKENAPGHRQGDRRYREAHRPLSLLPGLHDDLPVGRQLYAPSRSRPAVDRAELSTGMERAGSAVVSRHGSVTTASVSISAS